MSYFNIDDYQGNYCMHCKTQEEANNFCKYLDSVGRKWSSGDNYLSIDFFCIYEFDTVYFFNEGTYSKISYAKSINYTILEWSDFMTKDFTKSDLKSGLVVEYANGDRNLVVGNKIMRQNGFMLLEDYNEDLTCDQKDSTCSVEEFNINRVYESYGYNFNTIFKDGYLKLIWERKPEPIKELTLAELEKILGYKVKIISD